MEENKLENKIDARIKKIVPQILKGSSFTDKKTTDTPTDNLQVVNRRYVNLNGPTSSRPTSSILGQFYFDTDDGAPRWWSGSTWVDASGNPA